MSFVTLTDANGVSVAINPEKVVGIVPNPGSSPVSSIVRTVDTENFCIPGTVAAVALLLASGLGDVICAVIKSSDGTILQQNAAAIAHGLTVTHNGAGDNTVNLATANAPSLAEMAVSLVGLDKESVSLGTIALTAIQVLGWDAAGAASNINFMITIIPTA